MMTHTRRDKAVVVKWSPSQAGLYGRHVQKFCRSHTRNWKTGVRGGQKRWKRWDRVPCCEMGEALSTCACQNCEVEQRQKSAHKIPFYWTELNLRYKLGYCRSRPKFFTMDFTPLIMTAVEHNQMWSRVRNFEIYSLEALYYFDWYPLISKFSFMHWILCIIKNLFNMSLVSLM